MRLLWIPCIIAALLIFWGIEWRSVWLDEAYSLTFAHMSLPQFAAALQHVDGVFALYYGILHAWLALDDSYVWARVFSGLIAIAGLPFFYLVGARLFGRRIALGATCLLALNWSFLYAAREIRMYSLLFTMTSVTWYCFLRALDRPTLGTWAALTSSTALSYYVHPFAFLTTVGQGIVLAIDRRPGRTRRLLAAFVIAALCAVPLFWFASKDGSTQIAWLTRPGLKEVYRALSDLVGGAVVLVPVAVLVAIGAFRAVRLPQERRSFLVAAVWLVAPLLVAFTVSYAYKPIFLSRYLVEIVPALMLLAAYGALTLPRRALVASTVVLAGCVFYNLSTLFGYQEEDWNGVGAEFARHAVTGDAVVFYPPDLVLPYRAALGRQLRDAPALSVAYPAEPYRLGSRPNVGRLTKAVAIRPRHIWLISQHTVAGPPRRALEQQGYRPVEDRHCGGLDVYEFAGQLAF